MTERVGIEPIGAFFAELHARRHEPLLRRASGTFRLDVITDGEVEHWHVTVRDGDVSVSRSDAAASAVVRTDRVTAEGLTTGRVNALASALRGALTLEGDLGLIILFQRLFPGPPREQQTMSTGGA